MAAMRGLPGNTFPYSGVLFIGILHGLCVWADDIVMLNQATGSSLTLPVIYSGNLTLVKWKFNKEIFAEYTPKEKYTILGTHLQKRVKVEQNKIAVTVLDLQLTDSGSYLVVIDGTEKQLVMQRFQLYIQNPITDVQIDHTQMWMASSNSCVVNLECKAVGSDRSVYSWSGFKNESGERLNFTLSPGDGAVTLNCTASNSISIKTASERLTCHRDQTQTDAILLIAVGGGGAALLLIAVVAALLYRKCLKGPVADDEATVYADVNPSAIAQKDRRRSSANGTSVYETVEDLRNSSDKTIYAKVMLPKRQDTASTVYEHVS